MQRTGKVFSIGYQERSLDDFLALLSQHKVDILVDVRETPWSYRREYARTALTASLEKVGVGYVHAKFVGNPKEIRRNAPTHEDCLSDFAHYLAENDHLMHQFDEDIGALVRNGKNICLACYERHPDDCHRKIVLDSWLERAGNEPSVMHLGPDGAKRFLSE